MPSATSTWILLVSAVTPIAAVLLSGTSSPVFRDAASDGSPTRALPGGVVLRLADGVTAQQRQAIFARHALSAVRPLGDGGLTWFAWTPPGLPALEAGLRAGDPSLQALARLVNTQVVDEADWRAVDPDGRAFENVNTPDDVARLGLGR